MLLKLAEDQFEELEGFVASEMYTVLTNYILPQLMERVKERVLSADISKGPQELLIEKARFEGGEALKRELVGLKEYMRKRDSLRSPSALK